jgi:manganese transport protein
MAVVTERDLAMNCRLIARWRPLAWLLYALAEVAIIATDLAEIIGSAIALNLLIRLPLAWGVVLTALDTLIVLHFWQRSNQSQSNRWFELAILVLVVVVAVCFFVLLSFTRPSLSLILKGFVPTGELFTNPRMMFMAIGILGATSKCYCPATVE